MTNRVMIAAEVLETAKTTGSIYARWSWVDASVWTERMLTALENGVQGGKWYSLKDKAISPTNAADSTFSDTISSKEAKPKDPEDVGSNHAASGSSPQYVGSKNALKRRAALSLSESIADILPLNVESTGRKF